MTKYFCVAAFSLALLVGCGGEPENTVVEAPADWQPTPVDDAVINQQLTDAMDPTKAAE